MVSWILTASKARFTNNTLIQILHRMKMPCMVSTSFSWLKFVCILLYVHVCMCTYINRYMCYNLLKKAGASHLHGKLDDVYIPTVVSFVFTTKTPPICSFFLWKKKKVFIINVYLFPPLDMCVFVYAYRVVRGLSCDYGRVGHILSYF